MATVYQPPGTEIFYSDFTYRGRRIRRSLETENRAVAGRRLAKLIDETRRQGWLETQPRWSAAAERFVDEWLPHNVKGSTATRYLVSLRQLTPFFEPCVIPEIDLPLLLEYVAERREDEVSSNTIRRDMNVLSLIFRYAIVTGTAHWNPVDKLWASKQLKELHVPIAPPTAAEVNKLAAAAAPMFSALIRFLSLTGLRVEEAAGLRWSAVDLTNRRELRLAVTKTGKPRSLPLTGRLHPAWDLLDQLHEHYLATLGRLPEYVFTTNRGDRYAEISSQYQAIRERAGAASRLHDLRHYFAVWWLQGGGNIWTLSKLLGHSSVKTTERHYASFATLDLHKMVEPTTET